MTPNNVSVKPSVWSPIYQVKRLSSKFLRKEAVHNPAFRNAGNPYAYTILQALRLKDTIIPTVAPVVFAVLVESIIVAVLFIVYKLPINLDDRMISMMGSAIAMLLAFRTNRSFERYNQGSQLWTNLATQIRHSARLIWTTVNPTTDEGREEKIKIMKLLLATAVATKHALRGVDPYDFSDLNQLLPDDFITQGRLSPRLKRRDSIISSSGPSILTASMDELFKVKTGVIPPLPSKFTAEPESELTTPTISNRRHSTTTSFIRHHSRLSSSASSTSTPASRTTRPLPKSLQRKCVGNVINVPLDILHHINHYVRTQRASTTLATEDATPTLNAISTAIDSVTKFEQILYFPVPTTYEVHIKQVLVLYFILLPFQLVKPMGWAMILATFIMSMTFFGTDAIAGEISDPFGNDENDLPLDYFCSKLQDDIEYIMDGVFEVNVFHVGSGSEDEGGGGERVVMDSDDGEDRGGVEERILSRRGGDGTSGKKNAKAAPMMESVQESGKLQSGMQLRRRKQ
ncbi:UNVERIFIED_CONTAM: hypothetical protein HDU68_007129 [Siphonaria sp. JEL0065]|nr:hypothetical protein HDU68_007129 [Siphonaria sp. JEL0065]